MEPGVKSSLFEDEFQTAFEFSAIGMALVSPDGKFLRVNNALARILGYTPDELQATDFQRISHPDDLPTDLAFVKEILTGRRNSYRMEKRYFHRDGKLIWTQLDVSLIRNPDRSPKYFISQIQDITEAKHAAQLLTESEKQLSQIVNTTHDGIWDWHVSEDYEYMSPRFWQMLGYDPSEKKHHPSEWQKLIFPEDLEVTERNFKQHCQSRGEIPFYQEVRYRHRDGKTVWVICRGSVVEWDEAGNPVRVIGSHTDITELKAAQESLVYSSKMVALGEMAGGIAHEINNPLTIIKGHADRIRMILRKTDDSESIASSVEQICGTVDRISKIIQGLKNFSRDSTEVAFEPNTLIDVIQDSLSFCQEKLKNQSISIEVEGDFSLQVLCSRVQISQVIVNLIINSSYAIQKLPEKWIRIELSRVGLQAKMSVTDSGPGIGPEIRMKIMDPFFTTKPIGEGTGLGLSISRGILENHSGRLVLDEKSKHTKFDLILPLLISESN